MNGQTHIQDDAAMVAELKALACEALEAKDRLRMTNAKFIREYPGLGSDKTLGAFADGKPEGRDLERWLTTYRAALATLRAAAELPSCAKHEDFTVVTELRVAVARAMRQTGVARFVLLQAMSGGGKSTAAELVRNRYGAKRVLLLEARTTWAKSAAPMLEAILVAHGKDSKALPISANHKLTEALDLLSRSRTCVMIDEAHHMGLDALNTCKSIINATPGEVVLLAMDTLWRKLEWASFEDARQLTQNRLCARIQVRGVYPADAEKMVERELGLKLSADALSGLVAKANKHGLMGFLRLTIEEARELAGKDKVDADVFAKAIAQAEKSR